MSAPALDRRSDYVSAVAVELGDLAPDDRAELIEELDDHVAALLDDRPGTDLVGELGTPRAYAAELRAAAGLSDAEPVVRLSARERISAVVTRADAAMPWLRPLLHTMRPVWWVLRGGAIGLALTVWLGWSVPSVQLVVLAGAAAAGSVWLAQRPVPSNRLRRAGLLLDVAAVLALFWVVVVAGVSANNGGTYYDTQYVPNCPVELSNLYGYDAQGKPLDGVRLYDQNGNPFDLTLFGCNSGQFAPDGAPNVYPYPTAPVYDYGSEPTGPPSSLAPLPGATVSGATVPGATVSGATASGATESPGGTPGGSATPTPTPTG